jgi:cation transport ATPase
MGPYLETESLGTNQEPVLVEVIEKLGEHEVLRAAAGFAPFFSYRLSKPLRQAASSRQIVPAKVTYLIRHTGDLGALALVEGRPTIFGREEFLRELGIVLQLAEHKAGQRLELAGYAAYYVTTPQRPYCFGIVGIRLPQR